MNAQTQNPNQLWGGSNSFGGEPGQVCVGEVKQGKFLPCMNKRTCYPETQTWILIMQMLHCKHRSLSAADGRGFTVAAARTAGRKRSEAPQSDGAATVSLGHFISPSHKGKQHAVEKKNV